METGHHASLFLALLLGVGVLLAGCLSGNPPPGQPATTAVPVSATPAPTAESPVVTVPASEMALRLSDLPGDYLLRDRTVAAYDGIGKLYRDLGWLQGYRVSFYRLDKDRDDMTTIVQEIDVYPAESVKDIWILEKETLLPPEDHPTDYQVPFPRQGDRSIAWRIVRTVDTVPVVTYTVIFTRKNVYERISMTGTSTDYELLKELAATASARIR